MFAHSPTCLRRPVPVVLAVQSNAVVNHVREHVSIPAYTEHFIAHTHLGNQGAKNVG